MTQEQRVLNVMLYRQTLMQRSLSNKLKEMEIQIEMQDKMLGELKEAIGYNKTDFKKLETKTYKSLTRGEFPRPQAACSIQEPCTS